MQPQSNDHTHPDIEQRIFALLNGVRELREVLVHSARALDGHASVTHDLRVLFRGETTP